ncbi:hypothetical protein VPKG_00016 [Vibrio phage pYD21-A]|uniref:hypothetical protein n=1 Tax=Vibrio phage pYD21-A TaxID=754049 RepID=UPI0002C04636|nr:hypothetical protein VPKG_00016 [Vibrio phage pYD21-A]AGH16053.1 hypothetical protein VPKG_00016 [Vibrio phage pYD21-A]
MRKHHKDATHSTGLYDYKLIDGIWHYFDDGEWNESTIPLNLIYTIEPIDTYKDPLNPPGTFSDPEQGKKSDDNKPPMELLPSNGLIEVAKAMGYGAKKYNESWPDMNWPKVKNAKRRYLGAALRHIMARLGGEVRDPESGELHVAHAAFCLLALCEFDGGYRKESK